jgi:hypothetical protein
VNDRSILEVDETKDKRRGTMSDDGKKQDVSKPTKATMPAVVAEMMKTLGEIASNLDKVETTLDSMNSMGGSFDRCESETRAIGDRHK